jgi:hypothetical protein
MQIADIKKRPQAGRFLLVFFSSASLTERERDKASGDLKAQHN